jgi:hypothetical protein
MRRVPKARRSRNGIGLFGFLLHAGISAEHARRGLATFARVAANLLFRTFPGRYPDPLTLEDWELVARRYSRAVVGTLQVALVAVFQ